MALEIGIEERGHARAVEAVIRICIGMVSPMKAFTGISLLTIEREGRGRRRNNYQDRRYICHRTRHIAAGLLNRQLWGRMRPLT